VKTLYVTRFTGYSENIVCNQTYRL